MGVLQRVPGQPLAGELTERWNFSLSGKSLHTKFSVCDRCLRAGRRQTDTSTHIQSTTHTLKETCLAMSIYSKVECVRGSSEHP